MCVHVHTMWVCVGVYGCVYLWYGCMLCVWRYMCVFSVCVFYVCGCMFSMCLCVGQGEGCVVHARVSVHLAPLGTSALGWVLPPPLLLDCEVLQAKTGLIYLYVPLPTAPSTEVLSKYLWDK